MRITIPVVAAVLSLSTIACSRTPGTRLEELRLEHRAARFGAEEKALEEYALGLHMHTAKADDPGFDADDIAEAWLELIGARGALEDMQGVEIAHQVIMEMFPGTPLPESAHLELAEAALAASDDRLARRAVDAILDDAYGYAHETRLVQNLATLLALKGDREGARGYYERIREMTLYAENPLRFRSLEIFRDYLDSVGKEFPHFSGTAHGDEEFDTRAFRGRPLFIHFWRRLGSLNHDIEFLEERRLDYPDLAVVSVNVGDPAEAVRQAVLKHAPEWPIYHDPEGELAESLGITFMGLYVHEPKGILIDADGRFAVLPGREGAIDIGLRTLLGPPHVGTPEVITRGNPAGESVGELRERFVRSLQRARDDLDRAYLDRLKRLLKRSRDGAAMERICLEIMRIAKAVDDLETARRTWTIYERRIAEGETSKAVEFSHARTMLTSGDAGESKRLVYGAVGDRREREDLYLLLELAAALSVLNDVDGAREAYEKVIEITGGAGEVIWRDYIEALDRVGRELDHFSCEGLDGGIIDTRDYRGKLLLIDFWGSWCHACIREMPHVFEAYNRYREDGFSVLGVVVRDTKEKARAFLRRTGYSWDQVFDEESSIANEQVVVGYPTTILVDREGKVRCTRTFGGGLEIALRLLVDRDLPPLPD